MVRKNKYGNKKTIVDCIKFDSKKESLRYLELREMERSCKILNLCLQSKFVLQVNGEVICKYIADFTYTKNDREVVEDVKGVKTAVYILKRKLMKAIYNITILET